MIEKIRGFIEDNTNINVTQNQVKLALFVLVSLITLVIVIMYQSGTGPQKDDTSVRPVKSDYSSGDYRQQ